MNNESDDIRAILARINKERVNSAMVVPTEVRDPLITEEELANCRSDLLTKCIKMWLVDIGMSRSKLKELHRRHYNRLGFQGTKSNNDRNNLISNLHKDNITWRTLVTDLFPVLGLSLENVELTVIDDAGKVIKINLNDLTKKISKEFPKDVHNLVGLKVNARDSNGQRHTIGGNNEEDRGISNN